MIARLRDENMLNCAIIAVVSCMHIILDLCIRVSHLYTHEICVYHCVCIPSPIFAMPESEDSCMDWAFLCSSSRSEHKPGDKD